MNGIINNEVSKSFNLLIVKHENLIQSKSNESYENQIQRKVDDIFEKKMQSNIEKNLWIESNEENMSGLNKILIIN